MNYQEFLQKKTESHKDSGFEATNLNKHLFDFQAYIVKRALKAGKYAIFADCGLGKTIMQLEWANQVVKHTGGKVLILAPLAVSGQTIQEGKKFGIEVSRFKGDIQISNYEQIDNINCKEFSGIVLDESSILKNFTGKIKKNIISKFKHTPYKLACTATPSPNDPMELGNHAEFLNVMTSGEMLSLFFVHDGGQTQKWRLKRHAIEGFYQWCSSWAIMISSPSDIDYSDKGYKLPELIYHETQIKTDQRNNGMLFNDVAVSATNFNQELRNTLKERMNKAAEIANSTNDNYIVWVKQNAEADYIKKLIPDAEEVRGNESTAEKERKLLGFAKNDFRVLITKSKIAQFGLNYQNCHNQIFASLDFSFESLYQSIRRSYRFGQQYPVNIHMITTDTMQNVIKSIDKKQKAFLKMQTEMSHNFCESINKISSMKNYIKDQISDQITLYNADCVEAIKDVPTDTVGLSVFSPPFADLYVYSDYTEDMGNCKNQDEFFNHFKFLIPELARVIKPGRICAVHCGDLGIQKGKEGYIGLRDFTGSLISAFEDSGFIYHCRITIWKNPVTEMQRTKALGLLHKQLKKDAAMSRVGIPDYILIFRNAGENPDPVKTNIPVDLWQKWASPVWMDINQSDTLQRTSARDEKDEKHICPLQLGVIERIINLWTNPGDVVLSPFMGIGSEGYEAAKLNRGFVGMELKPKYYDQAKKNIQSAIALTNQLQLI